MPNNRYDQINNIRVLEQARADISRLREEIRALPVPPTTLTVPLNRASAVQMLIDHALEYAGVTPDAPALATAGGE